MRVRVYATPALIQPGDLEGAAAVVIDALRMTSVAAVAMANGCAGLLAVGEVEEARALSARHVALLGGERNALLIEGFDFSNSPLEYTKERIGGRRLIITTSNGTKAILAAGGAKRLLLGGFVNARAVAEAVRDEQAVALVCAGTHGAFSLEDACAAGAIIKRMQAFCDVTLDDMAVASLVCYEQASGDLHGLLSKTKHYGRLRELGFDADLAFCLSEDTLSAVPERMEGGWFE